MLTTAIYAVVVLTAIGFAFGLVLAIADKKFRVETNPLIGEVEEVLPKGQCGACGFAGCAAYAEAVVLNPDVMPNLCVPGKQAVADAVAKITGKTAEKITPRIAHIKCAGNCENAKRDYIYTGAQSCGAANMLYSGPKLCKYGCLGFGTCVQACKFEAMSLGADGLPIVNTKRCTGCGACAAACPKKIIELLPVDSFVQVNCSSKDRGAAAKKTCAAACLGCGLCAKNCQYQAIQIKEGLAVVDASICAERCSDPTCVLKCPTGAIREAAGKKNLLLLRTRDVQQSTASAV